MVIEGSTDRAAFEAWVARVRVPELAPEAVVTMDAGLEVHCALDEGVYEKGRKISDEELGSVNVRRHRFHGDWNYTIAPRGMRP